MRTTLWVTAAVATAGVFVAARAEDLTFSKVAETGDRAAGLPSAITYSAIQTPMVDASRSFLFAAQLAGGTPAAGIQDSGVFLGQRGAVKRVARAGDVAPGTGGAVWSDLLGLGGAGWILRSGGRVAFPGKIDGADTAHNGGFWAGTIGNLALVAREGDPAPGTTVEYASGNQYFQDGLHLAMNDSGTMAFRAKLAGQGVTTANDQALFVGMPGALSLVARLGSAAPGAGGATFIPKNGESFSAPSIDASGNILFRGHLTGAGVTGFNDDAIWYGDPASPSIVVRAEQPAAGPGIPANSKFTGLGGQAPVLNDAGHILFAAGFVSPSLQYSSAVWLGPPNALVPIAVLGQPAPGDPQGATFNGSFQHLRMNASGHAAFHALFNGAGTPWALVAWDGATLRKLARTGDPAPGMPVDELFDATTTEDVFLNAQGKVLFKHTTTPGFIQGVWIADVATGDVQLVARTGVQSTFDGVSRQIIQLTLTDGPDTAGSSQDGRSSPFADDGTYAILALSIDGHSVVLTNAGDAPGPAASDVMPSTVSVGTVISVYGSGFGGGAATFKTPSVWLTSESSSKKIKLKVDGQTATDTAFSAVLTKLPKGSGGPATLHVQPKVKGAAEITAPVTIGIPHVDSLSAPSGAAGELVTITGTYFGTKKGKVRYFATVGDKPVNKSAPVKAWSDTSITIAVPKRVLPNGVPSVEGVFEVDNTAGESNTIAFTVDG